jgi:uncharacterized protein YjbI with pentapeptide repeats/uncharacterized protein YaaR (DUF327 family)
MHGKSVGQTTFDKIRGGLGLAALLIIVIISFFVYQKFYVRGQLSRLDESIEVVKKELAANQIPTSSPTPASSSTPRVEKPLEEKPFEKKTTSQETLFNFQRDRADLENRLYLSFIQAIGGIFVALAAYVSLQNLKATQENVRVAGENLKATQKNVEVAAEKQVTERFTQAINQLGSEKVAIRLGGIYALERIAKDSEKDHWTIMEVLTSFIREQSPRIHSVEPITRIVQAALTVISRRTNGYSELGSLDLECTNLSGARLSKANLSRAILYEAKLNGANLTGSDLSNAIITSADLSDAYLSEATLNDTMLDHANLRNAEIRNASLRGATLSGSDLSHARLFESDLSEANLISTNLYGSIFTSTKLIGAKLHDADLRAANLSKANLSGANLSGANLSGANLSGANLSGANLRKTEIDETTIIDAKWRLIWEIVNQGARGKDFSGKDFSNACLSGADLSGANLNGADLNGADLSGAKDLTSFQVKEAQNWDTAKYDEDFRQQLGLPPEPNQEP